MKKTNRKAISPVLATVILIAITLIAALAIAGFVFGFFGSFTNHVDACAKPLPHIITAYAGSNSVPHNGTFPNGTKWISFNYCTHYNVIITGHGSYPNNTQWWTVK